MSICSDIFISKEKARLRVIKILMYDQEQLVEKAVESMSDYDLTSILNRESDMYYYNIEKKHEEK